VKAHQAGPNGQRRKLRAPAKSATASSVPKKYRISRGSKANSATPFA
jgi:hypothetical protein